VLGHGELAAQATGDDVKQFASATVGRHYELLDQYF